MRSGRNRCVSCQSVLTVQKTMLISPTNAYFLEISVGEDEDETLFYKSNAFYCVKNRSKSPKYGNLLRDVHLPAQRTC